MHIARHPQSTCDKCEPDNFIKPPTQASDRLSIQIHITYPVAHHPTSLELIHQMLAAQLYHSPSPSSTTHHHPALPLTIAQLYHSPSPSSTTHHRPALPLTIAQLYHSPSYTPRTGLRQAEPSGGAGLDETSPLPGHMYSRNFLYPG